MQDDLNGVSANVSIFATIPLVILSALNPALWAAIAPEGAESRSGTKKRTLHVGTVPGALLPSGRLSAPLEYARGAFFSVAAPMLISGRCPRPASCRCGAHPRCCARSRSARSSWPCRTTPNGSGSKRSNAAQRTSAVMDGQVVVPCGSRCLLDESRVLVASSGSGWVKGTSAQDLPFARWGDTIPNVGVPDAVSKSHA